MLASLLAFLCFRASRLTRLAFFTVAETRCLCLRVHRTFAALVSTPMSTPCAAAFMGIPLRLTIRAKLFASVELGTTVLFPEIPICSLSVHSLKCSA